MVRRSRVVVNEKSPSDLDKIGEGEFEQSTVRKMIKSAPKELRGETKKRWHY